MNVDLSLLWLIIACALVTVIPRILPFVIVRNAQLPKPMQKWLAFIPVCLMTALVVQGAIQPAEAGLSIDGLYLLILLPTLITALWTKSLFLTVIAGVASAALLRWLF